MNATEMNKLLYKRALQAIESLYADTEVSVQTTRENLENLLDDIQMRLEALKMEDICDE